MKLISITIKDFRSITSAYKVPLSDFSVLVGPNNEGKSNVLAAIVLALGLLERGPVAYRRQQLRYSYSDAIGTYSWNRDYPVGLQAEQPDGKSAITLEFRMTTEEVASFKETTKVNLNTDLKLRIHLGKDDARVELLLQGKAKQNLTEQKIFAIGTFAANKVFLQYIPAVRTAEMAEGVINDILARRLSVLEKDPTYQSHIQAIEKLQQPILKTLSAELTATVSSFIPDVSQINLQTGRTLARSISRSTDITINDGAITPLRMKGDGIKSLLAISLMKHAGEAALGGRSLILAIEEPESHLHPRAVHRLRDVLQEVSKSSQVILTTHAVPLVDRESPQRNVIVRGGQASSAKNLAEVRDALGVHQADNLTSARLLVIVEGEEDEEVLRAWLPEISSEVGAAIAAGELAFDAMGGAGNLEYKVRLHKANICAVHVLLDYDAAGKKALEKAELSGAINASEYTMTLCPGRDNTELEDLVTRSCYLDAINAELGLSFTEADLTKDEKKYAWSERMKVLVQSKGKVWTKALEARLKRIVSGSAAKAGIGSLNTKRRQPIDALAQALMKRLGG